MRMPEERQKIVGKLIKVHRKEKLRITNSAKWTQRGFSKDVCSPTSLIKLEKGMLPRFYDVFEKIAKKFEWGVAYDPFVERKIERYIVQVRGACELGDVEMIQQALNICFAALKPVKDCIWYNDWYTMLKLVENYYIKEIFVEMEHRDYYHEMMELHGGIWEELMKNVLFNSAFMDVQSSDYRDLYRYYGFDQMKDTCYNYINGMLFSLSRNNSEMFKKLFKAAERRFLKKKNFIRLMDVYNLALIFAGFFDKNDIDDLVGKLVKLASMKSLPKTKVADLYFILGTIYYDLKEYEKALKILEGCYEYDVNRSHCPYLLVGNINHLRGKEANIPFYHEEELKKVTNDLIRIYRYYAMDKGDFTCYEKQEYLMNEILPTIGPEDDLTLDVLASELDMLVVKTKKIEDVAVFNEVRNSLLYGIVYQTPHEKTEDL
ncbi:MAG: hypothetical protein HFF02_02215 [Erysipelotrichaceae bacterium]|nr:hypothetical protein [Erysipelotrichaceae bacterium]